MPLTYAAVVVVTPLVVFLATVLVLGWQLQVVETSSMEPLYPQGSLAVVEPLDGSDVRTGMTVVFHDRFQHRLIAHRVVGAVKGEPATWRTKGDANRTEDPAPVRAADVRGRVRWAVPRMGRVGVWLRGDHARWLLIGVPIAALVLNELRGRSAAARHGAVRRA
jgi:signal peptidase